MWRKLSFIEMFNERAHILMLPGGTFWGTFWGIFNRSEIPVAKIPTSEKLAKKKSLAGEAVTCHRTN